MANFAELNEENYVIRVVRVGDDIITSDGPLGENDMHPDGEKWCVNFFKGGTWKQTSWTSKFRNVSAAIGGRYDLENDEFLPVKLYDSWVLSSDKKKYEAPVPMPNIPESSGVEGEIQFNPVVRWNESLLTWQGSADNGTTIYSWDPNTLTWKL
jgi:hypothetical protein